MAGYTPLPATAGTAPPPASGSIFSAPKSIWAIDRPGALAALGNWGQPQSVRSQNCDKTPPIKATETRLSPVKAKEPGHRRCASRGGDVWVVLVSLKPFRDQPSLMHSSDDCFAALGARQRIPASCVIGSRVQRHAGVLQRGGRSLCGDWAGRPGSGMAPGRAPVHAL